MSGQSGASLRLRRIDGEQYLRAADTTRLLREMSEHWRSLADQVPEGMDPRLAVLAMAALLDAQATEVDFQLIAGAAAS
jgi:hypothetical protein